MAADATTITLDPEIKRALSAQKPDTVPWNVYFRILKESADPKRLQSKLEAYLKWEYESTLALARSRYEKALTNPDTLLSARQARQEVRRLRARASGDAAPATARGDAHKKRRRARSSTS